MLESKLDVFRRALTGEPAAGVEPLCMVFPRRKWTDWKTACSGWSKLGMVWVYSLITWGKTQGELVDIVGLVFER